MSEGRFSKRQGLVPVDADITVREDAPHELRGVLVDFAYGAGVPPQMLRTLVCRVLLTRADENNWSPYPNIDREVRELVDRCEWFEVYDIIEAIYAELSLRRGASIADIANFQHENQRFASDINNYFRRRGIGWQLIDGRIEVRGAESFEVAVRPAVKRLQDSGLTSAAQEIHEALGDLGRRPDPDLTGAIQHALAAVECVARVATDDPKATLGEILKRHPNLVPRPLDEGLAKVWGYGSEMARHVREGRAPSYEEAELTVMSSAAIAIYLERKLSADA